MTRRFGSIRSRYVPVAPEAVRRRLVDPQTWPQWQTEIRTTDGPAPLRDGDTVHGSARLLGLHVRGRADMVTVSDGVVEHVAVVGVRLRIRYELRPVDGGVVLTHQLEADLPQGLLGFWLAVVLRWRLRRLQGAVLDRLEADLS